MTKLIARFDGSPADAPPALVICDAWLADGKRVGDAMPGLATEAILGRWPDALDHDATERLAAAVPLACSWQAFASVAPMAQQLDERARMLEFDKEIDGQLHHLQQVCHHPRLHLRVEDERVVVSRARRFPVRAIAELVSHPGDWERRTLRSIQPTRVLARQSEDEWNLYENRVAACLVDHLLAYVLRRLTELRKIEEALASRKDHGEQARHSHWRAKRIMNLWAEAQASKTEDVLGHTLRELERLLRCLQALLDSPLYRRVPRAHQVAPTLKPTNILVNDQHYRRVAALWRAWKKHAYQQQESQAQFDARRKKEAANWDQFVLHLVVRALGQLKWTGTPTPNGWRLERRGWNSRELEIDESICISVRGESGTLRLLPLCADFSQADGESLARVLSGWCSEHIATIGVHVGGTAPLPDVDAATGWRMGKRTVLLGVSPWAIDSEERMSRLIHGWLADHARPAYPHAVRLPGLPRPPADWGWLQVHSDRFVAIRAPSQEETNVTHAWANSVDSQHAKSQKSGGARRQFQGTASPPVADFRKLVEDAGASLACLGECPVCSDGWCEQIEHRPGKRPGHDDTWWAACRDCGSEWGLRRCDTCDTRYSVLIPDTRQGMPAIPCSTVHPEWPDRFLGRDVWAQPCGMPQAERDARCPRCGTCTGKGCGRCRPATNHRPANATE